MYKSKNGITLIALVVTIIVLLILAGISIMMLTGENGILGRAGEAKVQTGIAEVEEAAKLAYMGRLTNMETGITLGNIATDLRAKGYTVEGPLGEGAEVVNNVTIANPVTVINGGTEIVELVLDKGEASARYFAEVTGKYYEIIMEAGGNITVAKQATDISTIGSESGSGGDTIEVSGANSNITATNSGTTVTIEGVSAGTSSLNVTVNGIQFTNVGNITIANLTEDVAGIYIGSTAYGASDTITLDGAILLSPVQYIENTVSTWPATGKNSKYIWSTANSNVAEVTSDGILKCGTETGTTTITCRGANGTVTCNVTSTSKIVTTANKDTNRTLSGSKGANNPTIPAGFVPIDTGVGGINSTWNTSSNSQDTSKGLVIMDDRGNQFVWVPVPDVIYESSKVAQLPTTQETGSLTEGHNYTPMAINVSGNYKGLLYDYNATNGAYLLYGSNSTGNYQGSSSQRREPAKLTDSTYGDTSTNETKGGAPLIKQYVRGFENYNLTDSTQVTALGNAWETQMQNEYNDMVGKIGSANGSKGFWMARYEASYDTTAEKIAIIAGARTSTADRDETKTWYGLYQKMKDFSTSNYKSGMPCGSMWDSMLSWMTKNSEIVTTAKTRNSTKITGNQVADVYKNIYDLVGNSYEWTLEAGTTGNRTCRGGGSDRTVAPSGRSSNRPYNAGTNYSSRPTLYVE